MLAHTPLPKSLPSQDVARSTRVPAAPWQTRPSKATWCCPRAGQGPTFRSTSADRCVVQQRHFCRVQQLCRPPKAPRAAPVIVCRPGTSPTHPTHASTPAHQRRTPACRIPPNKLSVRKTRSYRVPRETLRWRTSAATNTPLPPSFPPSTLARCMCASVEGWTGG